MAIDTATHWLGVAVQGPSGLALAIHDTGLRHGATLVTTIQRLLQEVDAPVLGLELVVCNCGPGSFTGIRIGLAAAKSLVMATGCASVGVPSLDPYAYRHSADPRPVVVVLDARRRRFYAAAYREGVCVAGPGDLTATEVAALIDPKERHVLVTGPGAANLRQAGADALQWTLDPQAEMPDPRGLLQIGVRRHQSGADQSGTLVPIYLRKSEAELGIRTADQRGAG